MIPDINHLHVPHGTAPGADPEVEVLDLGPERCQWDYAFLTVVRLLPGESYSMPASNRERVLLPLSGAFAVSSDSFHCSLRGRTSVFERVTDFAYIGRDRVVTVASELGGEIAIPSAPARMPLDPWYGPAENVEVEVRGSGHATRQLTNFLAPHIDGVDRLTCVEVLTPSGNWSSHPPHKHDREQRGAAGEIVEANLEEIYYFRTETPSGFGMHRTYDLAAGWDVSTAVHDGDAFLVPSGYHGPCIANADAALWYLNVLAGPSAQRSLAFSDDPAHAHVRQGWASQAVDDRVPMTTGE